MTSTAPADPRLARILAALAAAYPKAECALLHRSAWELLVATILSAQCTDARVNLVTPPLFRKYPTVADFAALTPALLEPDIRSTGFYRNKAKSIVGAARRIRDAFAGQVPADMESLLTLPGVARKTANVVLGVWFHQASGVVVDTHVQRIARRLALTREEQPEKIERDLMRLLPPSEWIAFGHRVIAHGRQVCLARSPRCAVCPLEKDCDAADKTYSSNPAKRKPSAPEPKVTLKAGSKTASKSAPKAAAGRRRRRPR
jgi:endonuclease-3